MLGVNNQEGVAMMHEVSALECPGELSQLSFLLFFMLFFLHASFPSWPPPFLHLRGVVFFFSFLFLGVIFPLLIFFGAMILFLFPFVLTCLLSFVALPDEFCFFSTSRYIYRQQIEVMENKLHCRLPVKNSHTCKKGPVFDSIVRHVLVHDRRWQCTSCNIVGKL